MILSQFSIDCCQHAFASGALPRHRWGAYSPPPKPPAAKGCFAHRSATPSPLQSEQIYALPKKLSELNAIVHNVGAYTRYKIQDTRNFILRRFVYRNMFRADGYCAWLTSYIVFMRACVISVTRVFNPQQISPYLSRCLMVLVPGPCVIIGAKHCS